MAAEDPQLTDGRVSTRLPNGDQIVTISGEIDLLTATAMLARLLKAADERPPGGGHDVVADLTAVTFMDARGLWALLHADQRIRRTGGRLRLTGAGRTVVRLLAITGLDRHFGTSTLTRHAAEFPAGS
ncbi:STAS domain-containing protein [Herbidospora mongoliensis]|uniref:STAS domain-containing protein n=1 Tax=Herbidospora mongoliensis TaxID=688067 RepID=UPI0008347300|nr:STAS domain-containing protein [Herbidospora mongoliensis]